MINAYEAGKLAAGATERRILEMISQVEQKIRSAAAKGRYECIFRLTIRGEMVLGTDCGETLHAPTVRKRITDWLLDSGFKADWNLVDDQLTIRWAGPRLRKKSK